MNDEIRNPEVKRETARLLWIYAAIDRRVKAHTDEIAEPVSALLSAYKYPHDARWADAFPEEWSEPFGPENDGTEGLSLLERALDELGPLQLRGRLPARRLYAMGAAGLAFHPELPGNGLETEGLRDRFRNALTLPEGPRDEAEQLLEVVLDEPYRTLPSPGTPSSIARWWNRVRTTLPAQALEQVTPIDAEVGPDPLGPPPCSTGLVWIKRHGDDEPVATFTTEFEVDIPYDKAIEFAEDPERWACFALWCKMEYLGTRHRNGREVRQYLETVSLNCGEASHTPVFEIRLDFVSEEQHHNGLRVFVTEYCLSPDNTDGRVTVNEGSLVIAKPPGNKVRIKTTKRLRFSDPLDGVGFASVLCHVGYLSNAEDLICCSTSDNWQAAWPGWRAPALKAPVSRWVSPDMISLPTSTIRRTEAALNKWLDDYEKAFRKSVNKKAASGGGADEGEDDTDCKRCYTLDDMFREAVEMWRVALCEASNFADYDVRKSPMTPGSRQPTGNYSG